MKNCLLYTCEEIIKKKTICGKAILLKVLDKKRNALMPESIAI